MNQRSLRRGLEGAARLAPSKKVLRSLRGAQRVADAAMQRRKRIAVAIEEATRKEFLYGFDGIDHEILRAGVRYISGLRERR